MTDDRIEETEAEAAAQEAPDAEPGGETAEEAAREPFESPVDAVELEGLAEGDEATVDAAVVEGPSPEQLAPAAARWILGLAALAGVFIAAAPQQFFPVCEFFGKFKPGANGEQLFMRCHQTEVLAVWLGAAIAAAGIGGAIWGTKRAAQVCGALIALGGVATIALPVAIAPVCASPEMPCVTGTLPGLVVSGVFVVVLGAAALFLGLGRDT